MGGLDSVFFKELATGHLIMPPKDIWATQIGLDGFFGLGFFWGEQGWESEHGRNRNQV